MNKLRIVMFARYLPPHYSGAASQAFLLAKTLRRRGHIINFITQSWEGRGYRYQVEEFDVTAVRTSLRTRHQEFSLWPNLLVHLWKQRRDFDLLHSHGAYYMQSIVGPLGRILGKPSLVKASLAQDDLRSLFGSRVASVHRGCLGMVDAYVAISRDLAKEFSGHGFEQKKIHYIPNGVDTDRFSPAGITEKQRLRGDLGLPEARTIGLFVGVFDERKRIEWLAEHWVKTSGFGRKALLVAIGPVSREHYGVALRDRLKATAASHPNSLVVRGHTDDIAAYYRAADFFVFPSANEGLPNAVLEAMACGLPCAASSVSGSAELVIDGMSGATFMLDDVASLAGAVAAVQSESADSMGVEARRMVLARFSIEKVADAYERLYRSLLQ